jgi:methionyl-tRNA formyltransferase
MKIVFMGTPDFAVPTLQALAGSRHEIACVYTQPPAPQGRGQVMTPSKIHQAAERLGLLVKTPLSLKDQAEIEAFCRLDIDLLVVVAYGQILKKAVLDHPPLGALNLHASLLPRWRGAAPIQRAIMAGDKVTGIDVMAMSEGLDEGPILLRHEETILTDDTAQSLHDRLALEGAPLLLKALDLIEKGQAHFRPQDGEPIYAAKIKRDETLLEGVLDAKRLDAKIRGLSPYPGAYFWLHTPKGDQRIKVLASKVWDGSTDKCEAGRVILTDPLVVSTFDGAVIFERVQREGKSPQSGRELAQSMGVKPGDLWLK